MTVQMDNPSVHQTIDTAKNWRAALREQERSIAWLARQTGRPARSLYAYSSGEMRPTDEWLAKASAVLGEEVTR